MLLLLLSLGGVCVHVCVSDKRDISKWVKITEVKSKTLSHR